MGPEVGRRSVVNIHTSYTNLIYSSFATFAQISLVFWRTLKSDRAWGHTVNMKFNIFLNFNFNVFLHQWFSVAVVGWHQVWSVMTSVERQLQHTGSAAATLASPSSLGLTLFSTIQIDAGSQRRSINQSIRDCLSSRATSRLIVCLRNAGSDDNVRI